VLKEFLGLDYIIQRTGERKNVCISDRERKRRLIIPDVLFSTSEDKWLTLDSLPKQPLEIWDPHTMSFDITLGVSAVPVIYGSKSNNLTGTNYSENNNELRLPIDIFGSCFFMLSRYEEMVKPDRDEHDRFPANASLAYQEGFLERAIVNEYVEILWTCMQKLWPGLERKRREYRLLLSHDVDEICAVVGKPLKQVIRRVCGDIIIRRDANLAINSVLSAWQGLAENDPCNTFDFIMEQSEKLGVVSTFNFMTDTGYSEYDGRYNIDHPWVRSCLRRIAERGHKIGFHPTYGSYLNADQTKTEFLRLKKAAEKEGIKQSEWGGRQHYLRWQNPSTWQNWEDAGLNYDSTLGFADLIGFRTGCCYEYPVFNLKTRKMLHLREQPLVVMEGAVTNRDGTLCEKSIEKISLLNQLCKKFSGDFTLLWHNGNLITNKQKNAYTSLLTLFLN